MDSRTKIKKTLNYFIRLVIILATYGFIYRQVFHKKDLAGLVEDVSQRAMKEGFWPLLLVIFLLMFVNWGLETGKWRLLMIRIEKIPFLRAYRAVLTGVSVSMFTPNRVGEYFGRVFILEKGSHVKGILVTIIGSVSQLLVTIVAGSLSVFFFLIIQDISGIRLPRWSYWSILLLVPPFVILLLIAYFRIPTLSTFLVRHWKTMAGKFREYAEVFSWYGRKDLGSVLLMSVARYFIFTLQFYLMMILLGIPLPFLGGVMLISVIYLGLTIIPTVALAELGVRGSLSIYLINTWFLHHTGTAGTYEAQALAASSLIWFINLVIPALLGTFFVYNLKFFRR